MEPRFFITSEGAEVTFRPIEPGDAADLVDFHEHLSPESVYLRFFSAHPHLSPAEVARFTHVDGRDRFAVVAHHLGHLVGIARYDRVQGSNRAEVAFVVSDSWQHHGIGAHFLRILADEAAQHGIRELVAEVLLGNRTMIQVFAESGMQMTLTHSDGTITVELSLPGPSAEKKNPRQAGGKNPQRWDFGPSSPPSS